MGIVTALGLSLLLSPVPSDTVFVLPDRLAASPPEIDGPVVDSVWADASDSSEQRGEYLPRWLHRYNWHRPHASLKYRTSIPFLNIPLNNVVGLHT